MFLRNCPYNSTLSGINACGTGALSFSSELSLGRVHAVPDGSMPDEMRAAFRKR
jgi:hypothetical protein